MTTTLNADHRYDIFAAMKDYARSLYDQASESDFDAPLADLAIQYNKDAEAVLAAPTKGVNDDFLVVDQFVRDAAQTALIARQEDLLNQIRELRADLARVETVLAQNF